MSGQGGTWWGYGSLRVFRAEFQRHVHTAPISFWLATLIFPFSTVVVLFLLPRLHLDSVAQVLPAGYSVHAPETRGDGPGPSELSRLFVEALADQPYYRLEPVEDARRAFEAGTVALGVELRWHAGGERPGDENTGADEGGRAGGGPSEARDQGGDLLTLTVHRDDDFWSELFLHHALKVAEQPPAPGGAETGDVLVPTTTRGQEEERKARSGIIEAAPFILIGFAWFFLTVGVVETFVVERERRTLEVLLELAIPRETLVLGKLLFVLFQTALAQAATGTGFLVVGFSPWVLTLFLLVMVAAVPFAVLSFRYCRDMEDSTTAGWKNGLIFILGFPLVILGDDIAGRWSPVYQLTRAFDGPPPPIWFLSLLSVACVCAAWSIYRVPALAREWTT